MTETSLTYRDLTAAEQAVYDRVEQDATGRDLLDVLLDDHAGTDAYRRARIAEVLGGPGGGEQFRTAWTLRQLEQASTAGGEPEIVRRFDDGRTALSHATVDGYSLLEYADGSRDVVAACETQQVGPDPDQIDRADGLTRQADTLRAGSGRDGRDWDLADRIDQNAAAIRAQAFDWLLDDADCQHLADAAERMRHRTAEQARTSRPEHVDDDGDEP